MGANRNGNGGYSTEVWDQIQAEWLAGQLSLSDISRTYGPSRSTIRAKAKRFNWPPRGSLVDEVRKEIQSQLLNDGGAPASAPPIHADEIIDNAAKRGVTIVRRQRKLLAELLGVAEVTLEELREMAVISRETLGKNAPKPKRNWLLPFQKPDSTALESYQVFLTRRYLWKGRLLTSTRTMAGSFPLNTWRPGTKSRPAAAYQRTNGDNKSCP